MHALTKICKGNPSQFLLFPERVPFNTDNFQVKSPKSVEDKDLGVEVLTLDDPVNTVPSANLVSGEYLASSTDLTSPLVIRRANKRTEEN